MGACAACGAGQSRCGVRAPRPPPQPARVGACVVQALHRRRAAQRRGGGGVLARDVRLSSADRVLFPDDGITKGDLFDYYGRSRDALVPHLKDRPFTMKRWREGLPGGRSSRSRRRRASPTGSRRGSSAPGRGEGESRLVDFPLVDSPRGAALDGADALHRHERLVLARRQARRPDYVLFDLDPPEEPDAFALCIRVAHLVREALEALGLASYVKTSGADGIHVLVPIARRSTYGDTYEFAELLSRRLEAEHPGEVTTEWLKKKREGVLVDHRQNGHGKTIASVYSVRPKPGAPVSTPLALGRADRGRAAARLHDGGGAPARRRARRPVRAGAPRPEQSLGAALDAARLGGRDGQPGLLGARSPPSTALLGIAVLQVPSSSAAARATRRPRLGRLDHASVDRRVSAHGRLPAPSGPLRPAPRSRAAHTKNST